MENVIELIKVKDFFPKFNDGRIYNCDKCNNTFKGIDCEFTLIPDNIEFITANKILFKGKEYLLSCPLCKGISFFGFDLVGEEIK